MLRRLALYFAAVALLPCAFAQEFRATVNGHITDPSGTGIPNAKVTVRNAATNEIFNAESTSSGDYTVPFLKPGMYTVTAEVTGFKSQVRENIEARVADRVTVDFQMQVGDV